MKWIYTIILIVGALLVDIGAGAKTVEVTLTQAGTLNAALSDNGMQIDTLVVKGPIDSVDFHTMWYYSYHGKLEVLDLSHASVAGGKVPDSAFYRSGTRTDDHGITLVVTYIPKFKSVKLPDDITEIGVNAFCYNNALVSINLPKKLRKLGISAFYSCENLNFDKLVIPEGVNEVPDFCFYYCLSLQCEVVLPSSIERIGHNAFNRASITKMNFPDGLKEIGDAAIFHTLIKEAILPDRCSVIGMGAFCDNKYITKLKLPATLKTIPVGMARYDEALYEVTFPTALEEIGQGAFALCGLQSLDLPEGLRVIRTDAFLNCHNIATAIMPSSLDSLETNRCGTWTGLKGLYSKSAVPPAYTRNGEGHTPFGDDLSANGTPDLIPLYVPKGSKQAYSASSGWKYFKNIVETDSFPSTTGVAEAVAGARPMIVADGGSIVVTLPKGAQAGDVEVYGTDGRILRRTPLTGQRTVVDMSNVPRGIYIVRTAHAAAKVAL